MKLISFFFIILASFEISHGASSSITLGADALSASASFSAYSTASPVSAPATIESEPAKAIATALELAEKMGLAEHPEWLKLIHFEKNFWSSGFSSIAKSQSFFNALDGRSSPRHELEATVLGFYNPAKKVFPNSILPSQSVRCQFPARWRWLSKKLTLPEPLGIDDCIEFKKFQKSMSAKSATLVFSSFFLNNPSSTFGHTLLRLNKSNGAEGSERQQLLDFGINFAANPPTDNPLLYALGGLGGFFPGTFSAVPYYYKVREYNDSESRDLWEYDLVLSDEEVQRLIDHIWELGFTTFDYLYFSKNCSYQLLSLLEVAAPRLQLVRQMPYWVIPLDTVKTVTRTPGLVAKVNYRPSSYSNIETRIAGLREHDLEKPFDLLRTDFDIKNISPDLEGQNRAEVIDAAIDLIDFKYREAVQDTKSEIFAKRMRLLVERSKLGSQTESLRHAKETDPPDLGHDSFQLGLSQLQSPLGNRYQLGLRFALHDMNDAIDGYPSDAQVEFFNFKFQYDTVDRKFAVDRFNIIDVWSMATVKSWERPLTWRVNFGGVRIEDRRCERCFAGNFSYSLGWALKLTSSPAFYQYIMLGADLQVSTDFPAESFQMLAGPIAGLRLILTRRLVFTSELAAKRTTGSNQFWTTRFDSKLRWSPDLKWSFDVGYLQSDQVGRAELSVFRYF
jgi:hypothetical protein